MAIERNRLTFTDGLNKECSEVLLMVVHLPMHTEILPPEEGEAEGCVQCQEGRKLVLFVTGKCHWGCDYCPLSENRRESPDMFANERRCSTWEEVIEEGHAMKATGTGITGGDPMLDAERPLKPSNNSNKPSDKNTTSTFTHRFHSSLSGSRN